MRIWRFALFGIAILAGLVAVWVILAFARPYEYRGSVIDTPVPAKDFTLIDQDGEQFTLGNLKGKAVLIFFGYTHCPDVCPATLSDFKKIKTRLGMEADQVHFVFITADPERDTPEQIKAYLGNFDTTFIGLTGEIQDLEQVLKDYGVYRAKVESDNPQNYLVDHSARIYLIDPKGNLKVTYLFGTESSGIAADVSHVLKGN